MVRVAFEIGNHENLAPNANIGRTVFLKFYGNAAAVIKELMAKI